MILVYITCKDKKEAEKIARELLTKKLIACANIFPINSIFIWKSKVQKQKEFVLIVKSTNQKYNLIENEVKRIHSYEIPAIIKINASANNSFEKWVQRGVK